MLLIVGYEWSENQAILSITFIIFGIVQTYMLWDFNVKSQNVVDEHGDLLELVDQYMLEHNFSKLQCPKMAKLQATMEKFQGFNALNYFTLNKSCLTSIVANFMTYLIVLLQFKSTAPNDPSMKKFSNFSSTTLNEL